MNKIQYMHIRAKNDNCELTHNGGLTIGYLHDDDDELLKIAYSKCHPDDRFIKSIGRNLTIARIRNEDVDDQYFIIDYSDIVQYAKDKIYDIIHGKHSDLICDIKTINDLSGSFINEVLYILVKNHIQLCAIPLTIK